MGIEYRGDGKYRFRVQKDGLAYKENFICSKKITEEDIKDKNWPKEVQLAHNKFEINVLEGKVGTNENMKFSELAQLVLDEYMRPMLRTSTVEAYISLVNNHLLDFFGDMKISKIKVMHVQKFINKKLDDNTLKLSTVKSIYKEFKKIMNKAVEWELLKEVSFNIKFAKKSKTNYNELLSNNDIDKLVKCISRENDLAIKTIYTIALFTGMRQAEILALQFNDIDLKNKKISINKQYGKIYSDDKKVVRDITDTKTTNSVRTVYIPDFITEIIKSYISSMKILHKDGFLFFNIHTQKPYSREWITKKFRDMLLLNNIPLIRFHDLRHLYATIALNNGTNIVTVAKTMGDTIETVIRNYTHGIDDIQQSSTAGFDKYAKIL